MTRTRRCFTESCKAALLEKAGAWRKDCQRIQAEVPIFGDAYNAVTEVMRAIDDLAGALTGNREHFWTKQHSIGGPKAGRGKAVDTPPDDDR